jgi:hypothetical protein
MKSRQFCSVCKQWLDMEVVPTGDGDDDGVVWFRCPQCQGFLPKLSAAAGGAGGTAEDAGGGHDTEPTSLADTATDPDAATPSAVFEAELVADPDADDDEEAEAGDDEHEAAPTRPADRPGSTTAAEPVLEYAAMLAAVDPGAAVPYRPWESYEVGQCVLHLAWNDCGVVVAKEVLPGGRRVIKCWFQGAGVVRLIENAPR